MNRLRYRILGPLEALGSHGPLPLGPPKQRALLGVLLLHRGEAVTVASLIDDLWGEDPPRTAEHSIQTYVSGLRAVLGQGQVTTTPEGYRLPDADVEVDAAVFERLAVEAAEAEKAGDPDTAFRVSGEALALWRGAPLAGLELANRNHPRLVRLSEVHLQAAERWVRSALALGRPQEVLADLERLSRENPLRETLWGLRMQALDGAGRTAEALRVYQELRKLLGEEMGIEPSRDLQVLEESLLVTEAGHSGPGGLMRNPYKGLRAFGEGDAPDFFGRQSLVRQLIEAVAQPGRPMVAVVGPSGSGKSSVVRAGLIPALRTGAIEGSENWTYALAAPAARPFEELASALPPDASERSLRERLTGYDERRRLLLVLDQFEEIFTIPDDEVTTSFLDFLADVTTAPGVHLVVTLRADFYHRPLLHARFGRVFASGVVHVHPLNAEELAAAAVGPTEQVGARLEPALVSELIRDVAARPGSLPLFQYALTEVFDRRVGDTLTLDAYRSIGGVSGALIRRAEAVFDSLTGSERDAARQLFFRLVAVGEGDQVTRRRPTRSEIESLGLPAADLERVIEQLGRHRLISHDRDHVAGEPTLEVAHEALLSEWPRLRSWLDEARTDLRRRASLLAAREEWVREGEDPGFLLVGSRLEQYEDWARTSRVALTDLERAFLVESAAARDAERAAREAAEEEHRRLARRSRLRRWGIASAGALAIALPLWLWWSAAEPELAVMSGPGGDVGIGDLFWAGIERAEQRHGIEFARRTPLVDVGGAGSELCRSEFDLVVVALAELSWELDPTTPECADTTFVFADVPFVPEEELPNVIDIVFRPEEGSLLAGAAAALATETNRVGFVGGASDVVFPFLAGFEAGVHAVDDDVEVLAVWVEEFDDPLLGRAATDTLVEAGADVIFHAAGQTGDGVLAGVTAANQEGERPVWFIGVDVDEWLTAPPVSRPYVLTSVVKRLDVAVSEAVDSFMTGEVTSGALVYGLANGGMDLTTSGGNVDAFLPRIESVERQLMSGDFELSPWETNEVTTLALPALTSTQHGTLEFADGVCRYDGPTSLAGDDVLRITISGDARAFASRMPEGATLGTEPISTEEPPPPEVDPATTRAADLSLTLPAIEGTWSVGCITEEWVYPTAAITVQSD